MNSQKPFDLKERTFQFALAILNWAEKCPRNFMTREMIRQLIDAGTSVGANTEEAEYAQSRRDEASKLGIALKEAAEAHYWIRLFKAKYKVDHSADLLLAEAEELKKIFKSRVHKLKIKKSNSETQKPNSEKPENDH
jgi:four helix bundle protein